MHGCRIVLAKLSIIKPHTNHWNPYWIPAMETALDRATILTGSTDSENMHGTPSLVVFSCDNFNPLNAGTAIAASALARVTLFPYHVFRNRVFGIALETIFPVVRTQQRADSGGAERGFAAFRFGARDRQRQRPA